MTQVKILIVEDEIIIAKDIQRCLERKSNITTIVAVSGEAAVKKSESEEPDLILMDIALPGKLDGIEAADKIRLRSKIPVVYLTSYADQEILDRAKKTEPYGFLVKPFEESELYSTIEIALYKHKMTEAFNRQTENFTSVLIHDLKNPLVAVVGYTKLLSLEEDDKEESLKVLSAIKTACQNMVNIIDSTSNSLVQKFKINSFSPEEIRFDDLITHTVLGYLPSITSKGLQVFINEVDATKEIQIAKIILNGDPYQLRSLLENLLSNAVKYANERIDIKVTIKKDEFILVLSDDGSGIPPKYHEKIFEEYFQIPGSKRGTGFGLYNVKKIVENHMGTLTLKSQPGKGASFEVQMPIV